MNDTPIINNHPPEHISSAWVCAHAHHIKAGGTVLDIAAGYGRNARWLAAKGFVVEALDKDAAAIQSLQGLDNINTRLADIEAGAWPYPNQQFDAIVVCRYLHRPLLSQLPALLAPSGVLIYETFMQGQERYGRPQNPDFLLNSNELLQVFMPHLIILAYEEGLLQVSPPAMLQRVCAMKA
jgi:SAM-dependent methyltransferase